MRPRGTGTNDNVCGHTCVNKCALTVQTAYHDETTVLKGLRARGVGGPVPISWSGSQALVSPTPQCMMARMATAAATAPGGQQAGGGLVERVKAVGKSIAAGLPLVAFSTISGGVLAGSLHTVTGACASRCCNSLLAPPLLTLFLSIANNIWILTGPDHLAALLPRCIGKRWYQAMRIGAVWGLGESAATEGKRERLDHVDVCAACMEEWMQG